jgi:cobalt-zinc-cadmium efflux system outer membrane protein
VLTALLFAAGCATANRDLTSIKNPGAEVESTPLPAELVRGSTGGSAPGPDAPKGRSRDVILTGAEEQPPASAERSNIQGEREGAKKLERRIEVPKELPGADVPPLRPPRRAPEDQRTPENEKEYSAGINKLYPKLPEPPPLQEGPATVPRQKLTLDELEQMALANSPIIPQYQSDVTGQAGSAIQAGTHPNPLIGIEQDTVGSAGTRNYQGVYAVQLIKTAGKLELAQAIENVDLMNTQLALRQARNDLLTQVRRQYFALLVARESVKINEAIVRFTHELYRIQVDQVTEGEAAAFEPAQLRTFVYQGQGALIAAQNRYKSAWQQLTSILNLPYLPVADLADHPGMAVPLEDYDVAVSHVLSANTEARAARNGPWRARLAVRLAEVTPIPDINFYVTVQKDFTTPGTNRATYNSQFGMPIPLWDRNRGNIQTARASLVRATEEVPRVENDLRARLASAFERFETNRVQVSLQKNHILPDAVRTYRGTYQRHIEQPTDVGFADVVVAQQTLLNAVTQYIAALNEQWSALVDIAALLQIDSLRELNLQLQQKDEPPADADREAPGVSDMINREREKLAGVTNW